MKLANENLMMLGGREDAGLSKFKSALYISGAYNFTRHFQQKHTFVYSFISARY